ncbi:transglycosylase domain-containing protein [Bifidobacterium leontopitheci]|uniref:Penicillin-binding protein n=1 Tax=Bifidobacterium leontopitheci TaxID=2650774 RepID=A0A6I1GUR4_9BIFI|nr:transglycosylase domain-containing protein [Bifidobacterium leontopitheci]KAB7790191.1 penicillin-binding protein [Bifidobacterium leontopitheci]
MVSHKRNAHTGRSMTSGRTGTGAAASSVPLPPRRAASGRRRSSSTADAYTAAPSRRRTSASSYAASQPLRSTRAPEGAHRGGGSHRAPGSKGPKAKGRKKHLLLKWMLGIIGLGLALGIGAFAYLYITIEIPQPESIALAEKTSIYYSDGKTKIGTFAEQNREIIDCSTLPKYVGQAVVASENRTFYQDRGIDLKGIARALVNNVTKGTRQGGSTITQQYAERYYLGETTTYMGKLKEAILAVKIAQSQSKDSVLCNYLNTIYLGRSAYGIQAAAQAYFGKDAKDLSVDEAAMLAGIIPSPSNWDPAINPTQATSRFKRVINIMKEDGYITAAQASKATMPKTVTTKLQNIYQGPNGYLLQMVRRELINSKAFTQDDLDTGGYTIITTIDKSKQDLMYQTASPTKGNTGIPDGVQTGGLSVNVKDGSIISLYAGEDFLTKQLNNVTDATYEVGSTMKPFTLLTTVQAGVSLDTVFNGNSPRDFPGLSTPMSNSGNASYGYINLYQATANSVNTVYMDLQQHLGGPTIIKTAQTAGVTGKIANDAYVTLGNSGLSMMDMARGISTIANQGKKPTLHIVASVKSSSGQELYKTPSATERVFDANDTGLVVKAMEGTIQFGTGSAANVIGKTMAGKSGTANDNKAVSFIGFTPSTLTMFAMWNQGPNGEALEVPTINGYYKGMGYPAVLFTRYMQTALANVPDEKFPDVTDSGTVGGPDGTWGLGKTSWTSQGQAQQTPQKTDGSQSKDGETSGNSSGSGSGDGNGSGSGSGSNDGSGSGNGSGSGSEGTSGNGSSSGSGDNGSSGNGSSGEGSGSGDGSGSGSGEGSGSGGNADAVDE